MRLFEIRFYACKEDVYECMVVAKDQAEALEFVMKNSIKFLQTSVKENEGPPNYQITINEIRKPLFITKFE